MGPFDWLRGRRQPPPDPAAWQIRREGGEVVVQVDERTERRFSPGAARHIRLVPLGAGAGHGAPGGGQGWQVTAEQAAGDLLIGPPVADWQAALAFARRLCQAADLPLDPLTEGLFSRVEPASTEQDAGA